MLSTASAQPLRVIFADAQISCARENPGFLDCSASKPRCLNPHTLELRSESRQPRNRRCPGFLYSIAHSLMDFLEIRHTKLE